MALSRFTKAGAGGSFTRNTRIAFGNGCDCPSYVALMMLRAEFILKLDRGIVRGGGGEKGVREL